MTQEDKHVSLDLAKQMKEAGNGSEQVLRSGKMFVS